MFILRKLYFLIFLSILGFVLFYEEGSKIIDSSKGLNDESSEPETVNSNYKAGKVNQTSFERASDDLVYVFDKEEKLNIPDEFRSSFEQSFVYLFNNLSVNNNISHLAELGVICESTPSTIEGFNEELSFVDELNELTLESREKFQKQFEFCKSFSSEDYQVIYEALRQDAEEGNINSQLQFYHMDLPNNMAENPDFLETERAFKIQMLNSAFEQGSVHASAMLAAENIAEGNYIEAYKYALIANKYEPHDDFTRLVEDVKSFLKHPDMLKAEEELYKTEELFSSTGKIHLIRKSNE